MLHGWILFEQRDLVRPQNASRLALSWIEHRHPHSTCARIYFCVAIGSFRRQSIRRPARGIGRDVARRDFFRGRDLETDVDYHHVDDLPPSPTYATKTRHSSCRSAAASAALARTPIPTTRPARSVGLVRPTTTITTLLLPQVSRHVGSGSMTAGIDWMTLQASDPAPLDLARLILLVVVYLGVTPIRTPLVASAHQVRLISSAPAVIDARGPR